MINTTASFLLAAYVLYIVANGDLSRLSNIVGLNPTVAGTKPPKRSALKQLEKLAPLQKLPALGGVK